MYQNYLEYLWKIKYTIQVEFNLGGIKMPLIDMPLKELLNYNGKNPKPSDFDEFWDKSLKEMNSIDPEIELIPAEFQTSAAECFHLYFTGIDGSRIYAKYLRPRNVTTPHPAVLQFHGYTGHSGDWQSKLNYISAGFSVAALDCRGQGGKSEDRGGNKGNTYKGHIIRGVNQEPENMLFRKIYLDTAQLAKIVMSFSEVDENNVCAMGGSQGGGLTLACASLEPRIKKAAPIFPFLCDYKRVWEMDLAINAYAELKEYFRLFDPMHEKEEEFFTKLGYIDVQNLTSRINAEVLMGVGLSDNVCPPSTQFAAFNKITSKKNYKLFPDFGHEGLPGFDDIVFKFMTDK